MSEVPILPSKRPITLDDLNSVDWWDGYKKIEIVNRDWYFGGEQFYRSHDVVSGWIQTKLMTAIWEYVEDLELGLVYSGSVGFVLEGHRDDIQLMRRTDISLVLKENIATEKWEPYYRAPDLAIEIITDDLPYDVEHRSNDFLSHGTQEVWQVYPELKQIIVHRADGTSKKYGMEDTILGGDLLAGFALAVSKVFES